MNEKLNVIPYRDKSKNEEMNLLLVEPVERQPTVTSNGLIIAGDVGKNFEESRVVGVCKGSLFSVGDIVTYKKLNRNKKDLFESVHYNGNEYDVIGEPEVWSVNDFPYNRIFIQPDTIPDETSAGLIIPKKVEGITQKGRIVAAPPNSIFKVNDEVEYRRNNDSIYYNAIIDGAEAEVLYEPDVYLINGKCSPYKIIIRIDMAAQKIKKETTESGLIRSPLYSYMLFYLQYGEVMEIGEKSRDFYPELNVGDTAILHHFVEDEEFRILKNEYGKHGNLLYQYRIIHCLDKKSREIFGTIYRKKVFSSGANVYSTKVTPFGGNVFLKWKVELLHKEKSEALSNLDIPTSLEDYTDLLDMKEEVGKLRDAGVRAYKEKMGTYTAAITYQDQNTQQGQEEIQKVVTKIGELRRDQERAARYVNADHLVVCTQVFPKAINSRVICTYKELYPLNVMGEKYIIAHPQYIFLNIDSMNKLHATGDKVLVKPIVDEQKGGIDIPLSVQQLPQKGIVVSVGSKVDDPGLKEGNLVLYRKGGGMLVKWEGEEYYMMKEGDVMVWVESERQSSEDRDVQECDATDSSS